MRPAEVDVLRGDYTKAKEQLGWEPATPLPLWVGWMVDNDLKLYTQDPYAQTYKK